MKKQILLIISLVVVLTIPPWSMVVVDMLGGVQTAYADDGDDSDNDGDDSGGDDSDGDSSGSDDSGDTGDSGGDTGSNDSSGRDSDSGRDGGGGGTDDASDDNSEDGDNNTGDADDSSDDDDKDNNSGGDNSDNDEDDSDGNSSGSDDSGDTGDSGGDTGSNDSSGRDSDSGRDDEGGGGTDDASDDSSEDEDNNTGDADDSSDDDDKDNNSGGEDSDDSGDDDDGDNNSGRDEDIDDRDDDDRSPLDTNNGNDDMDDNEDPLPIPPMAVPDTLNPGDTFESDVVLAVNIDPASLSKIKDLGLAIERRVVLEELDLTITRFRVKKKNAEQDTLRRIRQLNTPVTYDLNHFYQLSGDAGCDDIRCYPVNLIQWRTEEGNRGKGIRLGMVDTPVDKRIPALRAQDITGKSFVSNRPSASKDHGSAIATLLVGKTDSHFPGMLPDAALFAANAFFLNSSGHARTSALNIAQSLDWLVSNKVMVINLSLAGYNNKLLRQAVRQTLARNIPIIAAAGNNGFKSAPVFPAATRGVIAVTAVDRFLRPYRRANSGRYINFAAPGVGIWTPGDYGRGQLRHGTSYACAYVTGIVAELLNRAGIKNDQASIRSALKKNVLDLGRPGRDPVFGWGLVRHHPVRNRQTENPVN